MLVNKEKVQLLAQLYLEHTGLTERSNIDLNDLNVYINHALENGLVDKEEVNNVDGIILKP